MVVDRGCQTACTVEVQTDPEPSVFSCGYCYANYFGHAPSGSAPPPCCGGYGAPMMAMPQQHRQAPFGFLFGASAGGMSKAQQQEAAYQQVKNSIPLSSAAINAQMDLIQRQIDALTRRIQSSSSQI